MTRGKASLLTASHRQYLIDGTLLSKDKPPKNTWEYEKQIRKRLAHLLADMGLLFDNLEQEQLRQVFSEPLASVEESNNQAYCSECDDFIETVNHDCDGTEYDSRWGAHGKDGFAFLAWALNATDEPLHPPYDAHQPAFENFVEFAEKGLEDYILEKHDKTADVSINIELSNVDRAEELYQDE